MKPFELNVHNLPRDVAEQELAGSVVIVIDVLRATSTICQAIASGASEVVPFVEVDEALFAASQAGGQGFLLGGERKGLRIKGFDLGNSPAEYTPEAVGGRCVLITTTNGTRALRHARLAKKVFIGSFLNLSAVVASLKSERHIDILCAGTDGSETSEDILLAGAIVHELMTDAPNSWQLNEAGAAALKEWQMLLFAGRMTDKRLNELVEISLYESPGGKNLLATGNSLDIRVCASVDSLTVVPELNVDDWRITA